MKTSRFTSEQTALAIKQHDFAKWMGRSGGADLFGV